MTQTSTETRRTRTLPARIGVTLLNVLSPGLGLLRLGEGRIGTLFLAASPILLLTSATLFAVAPTANFVGAAIFLAVLFGSALLALLTSMVLSWRRGGRNAAHRPWWSRWYGVLLALVVTGVIGNLAAAACHDYYKPFYVPAESMVPALDKNDKFVANMRGGRRPKVGEIILFLTPRGDTYIKRVAAVSGDRFAMKAGVPVINGKPASQADEGSTRFQSYNGLVAAQVLRERLPAEAGSHLILDIEQSAFDDTAEQIVPPDHVFVLGDNRDNSADSRVPSETGGAGFVPLSRIVGTPLFIHWSHERAKIGQSLAR